MKIRSGVLCVLVLVNVALPAFAQSKSPDSNSGTPQMGTPEQRSACGPDVGRFCKSVKPEEGAFGYLACLKTNRDKLRDSCRAVLEANGQ